MAIVGSCSGRFLGPAHTALRRVFGWFCICALLAAQHVHAATYLRGFAVDNLNFPINASEVTACAIDLNGDGHVDNVFGSLLSSLSTFGMDIAGATAAGVATGQVVHLVELRSGDGAFSNDAAATASWHVGKATSTPPLFDGTDTFQYNAAFAPGSFVAALSGGAFVSSNPATTTAPVDITVELRIGNTWVGVPLQGARLKFTAIAANLSDGQVNGSIRKADVDTIIIPALAVALNDIVQSDPQSDTAQTLLSLFDTSPADGMISVDEFATNGLTISLFAPDVQIRNANGDYAPNPANTTPDALSFGFGFTAVESDIVLFADGFEQ